MKIAALLIACCAALLMNAAVPARAEEKAVASPAQADPKIYGQYPIAYKEIIERWMKTRLADPKSAVFEFPEPPKAGEYKTQKGETHVGYIVEYSVSARNQFGLSTGKQKYRAVIKNGEILWAGRATT